MLNINKILERLSRLFRVLINENYFINHKFQNKNQITNTNTIFKILKKKKILSEKYF